MQLDFTAPLWQWQARSDSWWFVTVPEDLSDDLASLPLPPRGFGSIRVRVTVGSTSWTTSVFPSDEQKAYVLPMKKAVRTAEKLTADAPVRVRLETIDL
ncbi:DUF1905 domain-containing protein [Antribacter gilvus]|uniref:DUF1905 domain-containing protein n=1 Tax=Antribacter gilvus TaxID=2304675 RepID=UPI000F7ABE67|nr:DUF1905 domain-containing protein [Antribacter gilvus]